MKTLFIYIILLFQFTILSAQIDQNKKSSQLNISEGNIAIQKYDVTSYFNNKPEIGNPKYQLNFKGSIYYFANQTNLEKFKKSPTPFEPMYGGWCAYAMGSSGEKVEIDPETYKIINGKLYLYYNKYFNNTLSKWNKSESTLKLNADKNWQKIIQ